MDDRASMIRALDGPGPRLGGEWRQFIDRVRHATWKNGTSTSVSALSRATQFLPGFATKTQSRPAIRVLAPVEFPIGGKRAIRRFTGGDSKNTNGNSVMLRIDYGRSRTILTGDLNKKSQQALLRDYAGRDAGVRV
jgi:beta-lactamase superfamily II metal-dependent hydrolase